MPSSSASGVFGICIISSIGSKCLVLLFLCHNYSKKIQYIYGISAELAPETNAIAFCVSLSP